MSHPDNAAERILVVQPSWVGDAVMATPTLRAIRELYPEAHISYLMRRYVKPIYAGMPWADQLITYRTGKTKAKAGKGSSSTWPRRLRAGEFDLAILLPNSFKTALVCKMAGIDRIVGYERDGRGFLLTDKLLPVKDTRQVRPRRRSSSTTWASRTTSARPTATSSLQLFVTDQRAARGATKSSRAPGSTPTWTAPRASGGRR